MFAALEVLWSLVHNLSQSRAGQDCARSSSQANSVFVLLLSGEERKHLYKEEAEVGEEIKGKREIHLEGRVGVRGIEVGY